ncbi:hypothetical protein AYO44_01085 [Planctomycetaceae bacterium SCGC AG-212-F19]|nr:hypothetical protein AYO44_01085 [Planctomycetaceae bacterium SCGC AG-212-F19]
MPNLTRLGSLSRHRSRRHHGRDAAQGAKGDANIYDQARIKQIDQTLAANYFDSVERIKNLSQTMPDAKVRELLKPPAAKPNP